MLKSIMLSGLLLIVFGTMHVFGQTKTSENFLINKEWRLHKDSIKGLGTHTALPKDTKLTFYADGTWKTTNPLHGLTEGKWTFDNTDELLLTDDQAQQLKLTVVKINDEELSFKTTIKTATYQYIFKK